MPPKSHQSPLLDVVVLSLFQGNGLKASDLKITDHAPSNFSWLLPSTDVPSINLENPSAAYAKITQIGVYDLKDLMALLSSLEANPLDDALAIVLFNDTSMHGAREAGWPKEGYNIKSPVGSYDAPES